MTKIVIVSADGTIIKFNSSDLPTTKRGGIGVRGKMMGALNPDGKVVAAFAVEE
jgi:DNA gyrase/topoisomerase IV subunit A